MAEEKKRTHQIKKVNNLDGSVTFNRANDGEKIVTVRWSDVPTSLHARAHTFFIREKFGNFYAGAENVGEAIEALTEGLARIKAGTWVERGEGLSRDSLNDQAVANLYFKGDLVKEKEAKGKATGDQWKKVTGSLKVKAEHARLVAARAADRAKEGGELVPLPV